MSEPVTLTTAGGVGHLQLNRPEGANTINMLLAEALGEAVDRIAEDDAVKAVLLTGNGKRFCAGGDISAFAESSDQGRFLTELAATVDGAVQALESLNKPVVAAVHGAVAGGGLGIMLAADVIIAAEGTSFVFAYPSIGLTPDCGTAASLPRAMGQQRALAFALSGQPLNTSQALSQGLVTEVVVDPLARAREVAAAWVAGAPGALGDVRRLLRQAPGLSRAEVGVREAVTIGERMATDEAQALVAAFVNR
ncbi:enoyl-CoA hydratase/isomerase family protein [Arthrobacter sp. ISL-85]|uniref:enoyl-CoA hydratase/isomerase family protein n=1 Tax=Arthrobacter sp. ISL-85 TaxID=2819115 RepID=UPI001BEB2660|nr:enoyl-CoA hydratase/isomerase family protein [Arthrobacter sp. ISL-85]MBT2568508.1 enoyl-CoA hydratase/isomerase family protein [Arthrobacter sp. ISL-85]